jgi:hypothetical protein
MTEQQTDFGTVTEYRGYQLALRRDGEWITSISRADGNGIATTATSSLAEGPDICFERAREIVDTYLTYLLDVNDGVGQNAEDFDAAVRDTAYFLWEQAGRPEGRAEEYWHLAMEQHMRARAYSIWLSEGRPEGRAAENWNAASKAAAPKLRNA